MAIPKAYQTGFSQPHPNKSLEGRRGFFSFYQLYNRLKYYFVFASISGAFILCLGKIFQRIETSYQDNSSSRIISNNKSQEKSKESLPLAATMGKFLPFKIGKDANAITNSPGSGDQLSAQQPNTPEFDPLAISSEEEVKILQALAHRRRELDEREKVIAEKEFVLTAAQKQIQEQMISLQKLKTDIQDSLKIADKNEKDKIMTLIKIYENMKPKEAARIFNQMDVKLLTDMVKFMNQKKISAILGHMNVNKAKEITALVLTLKSPYATFDSKKSG